MTEKSDPSVTPDICQPELKKKGGRPKGAKDKKPRASKSKSTRTKKAAVISTKLPKKELVRKYTLTFELASKIAFFVKKGNFLETAAAACGVSPYKLKEWLKLGNDALRKQEKNEELNESEVLHAGFVLQVEEATAEAEVGDLERLDSFEDVKAIKWKLGHRYENWKDKKEHEHKHTHQGEVAHIHSRANVLEMLDSVPLEARKQLLLALREKGVTPLLQAPQPQQVITTEDLIPQTDEGSNGQDPGEVRR